MTFSLILHPLFTPGKFAFIRCVGVAEFGNRREMVSPRCGHVAKAESAGNIENVD